ncbi:hypothetical protein [Mesorhizobium caraganae]|nr:hypothetical protein [Mesorhizobium caraganae]
MLAPFILLFGYIVSGFPSAWPLRIWENQATGRRTTPTMTA